MVRRAEVKYSRPAKGKIYSIARIENGDEAKIMADLKRRGRTLVKVNVSIHDQDAILTFHGVYEWYIQRIGQPIYEKPVNEL